jgi:hypothetical protein
MMTTNGEQVRILDGESRSLSGITTTFVLWEGRKLSERNVTQDGYQEGTFQLDTMPNARLWFYRTHYLTWYYPGGFRERLIHSQYNCA